MSRKGGGRNIEEQFKRLYAATQTKNFAELASLLRLGQSAVSDAKRRGKIPASWLRLLLCECGINPMWILAGNGAPMLVSGRQGPRENDFPAPWKPGNDTDDTPAIRT